MLTSIAKQKRKQGRIKDTEKIKARLGQFISGSSSDLKSVKPQNASLYILEDVF